MGSTRKMVDTCHVDKQVFIAGIFLEIHHLMIAAIQLREWRSKWPAMQTLAAGSRLFVVVLSEGTSGCHVPGFFNSLVDDLEIECDFIAAGKVCLCDSVCCLLSGDNCFSRSYF